MTDEMDKVQQIGAVRMIRSLLSPAEGYQESQLDKVRSRLTPQE